MEPRTKVIMDSGKEYIFNEHPVDFSKRFFDEEKYEIIPGVIYGSGFTIVVDHISSIEEVR